MILCIIYNTDLLEITDDNSMEMALGYVDDIALLATGVSFEDTTAKLKNLMEKQDSGIEWSKAHNS